MYSAFMGGIPKSMTEGITTRKDEELRPIMQTAITVFLNFRHSRIIASKSCSHRNPCGYIIWNFVDLINIAILKIGR